VERVGAVLVHKAELSRVTPQMTELHPGVTMCWVILMLHSVSSFSSHPSPPYAKRS
jgi:hypothetical protein